MIVKKLKQILTSKNMVTFIWLIGVMAIWEAGAFAVAEEKRSPQNILPHIYQIIASILSAKQVSSGQTALQIVLTNAGDTLMRAGSSSHLLLMI